MAKFNRRSFLKGIGGAAALAAGGCASNKYGFYCARTAKPGDKLNVGIIGCGGKGSVDWKCIADHGENIVAFCDVDRRQIDKALAEIQKRGGDPSKVHAYSDWRKMLEENPKLDAVTVSTPDHTHAPAAITAMRQGINVFVQKPLVRTLWEADYFGKVARATGVITQMGNQGSSGRGHRRNVELLQQGVIGDITEIHVWTDRPIWPQGDVARHFAAGKIVDPPAYLDWDNWLGTAKARPYREDRPESYELPCKNKWAGKIRGIYHQFNWRGFADFGTGAFGDMACHTFNLPFRGAELQRVLSAECVMNVEGDKSAYPVRSRVEVVFAARESAVRKVRLPETKLIWYDGAQEPSADIMPEYVAVFGKVPHTGCVIRGTKGMMISTNDYGQEAYIALKGEKRIKSTLKHEACKAFPEIIAKADAKEKLDLDHLIKGEFCDAIKGIGPVHAMTHSRCFADVEHSVPMMEGMLVGCIAQQVPGKLKWDSANRVFDNAEANALVRPYMRSGFEF